MTAGGTVLSPLPRRFVGKRQLWKYLGIGLTQVPSGEGYMHIQLDQSGNRASKDVIGGAAAAPKEGGGL